MSSTKRGSKRSPADAYATSPWAVTRFLEFYDPKASLGGPSARWLEPCAGEGCIIQTVNRYYNENGSQPPVWDMVEVRDECGLYLEQYADTPSIVATGDDFLKLPNETLSNHYSLVITNPPFRIAFPVIKRSLNLRADVVVMLLRLNFIGSLKRHHFFRTYPPDIYVLPERPSFKGNGETDSIEYAWFVWETKNLERDHGVYQLLDLTPIAERKKDHNLLRDSGFFPENGDSRARRRK